MSACSVIFHLISLNNNDEIFKDYVASKVISIPKIYFQKITTSDHLFTAISDDILPSQLAIPTLAVEFLPWSFHFLMFWFQST